MMPFASLSEKLEHYLKTIEEQNPTLNAFIEVWDEEARTRAKEIETKIEKGKAGKLAGLILGIKDNICYKGHKASASSRILKDHTAIYSATAVERLLSEDALIVGRLNCDEFAMGSSNENSYYKPVRNPLNREWVPGGSSGGSAAAVAAKMVDAALGSDTGGSVRLPAAFCSIYGFKPTYGHISRYGLIAYASSFDIIGPLANSIEDIIRLYHVMRGPDPKDPTSCFPSAPPFKPKPIYRIAYFTETYEQAEPEIKAEMDPFIQKLQASRHVVEPISFPYLEYVVPIYYVLTCAEASSNLARYDGIRYGFRSPNTQDLETLYKQTRTEGFGPEVKRRIMLGTFVLSAGYFDAYYKQAQKARRLLFNYHSNITSQYDFILTPTSMTKPFKLGEKTDDPIKMYLSDICTVYANLTGAPALSIPTQTKGIGIQLIGPLHGDDLLLQFVKSWNGGKSHE